MAEIIAFIQVRCVPQTRSDMTENRQKWRELENENEGLSGKDLIEMKTSLWTQAGSDDSTYVHS